MLMELSYQTKLGLNDVRNYGIWTLDYLQKITKSGSKLRFFWYNCIGTIVAGYYKLRFSLGICSLTMRWLSLRTESLATPSAWPVLGRMVKKTRAIKSNGGHLSCKNWECLTNPATLVGHQRNSGENSVVNPDPHPLVTSTDPAPDPSIIKQKE